MNSKISTWFFLIFASLLPSLGVGIYFFVTPSSSIWSPVLYYTLKTLQFTLPLLYFRFVLKSQKDLIFLYQKPTWLGPKARSVSIALMLFCFLFTLLAYFFVLKNMPFVDTIRMQILDNLTRLRVQNLKSFIMLALAISIIHSFLEEYYWRGFVDKLFIKIFPNLNRYFIYLLGAFLFTLHHLILIYKFLGPSANLASVLFFGFFVFAPGFVWSYQTDKYKSVYPAWLGHIGADLGLMLVALLIIKF